jgi:diguanylate cyclase (GGDEF)-like protein
VANKTGGALLITLSESGDDYLVCLREETVKSIDWAGDVRVPVQEFEGKLHPRTSFAHWRETVRGQSARWSALDIESAKHLRTSILERASLIERRSAQERLRYIAHHDQLTQLPNRAAFHDAVARLLIDAERDGSVLAMLFVDLDHFKSINDTLGHAAGDQILQAASARMRGCIRHGDVVARLGGDEFVVLSPKLSHPVDSDFIARKILGAIAAPYAAADGRQITCTASVGIAVYPCDSHNAEDLLHHADLAMYRAKRRGRNTFERFSSQSDLPA